MANSSGTRERSDNRGNPVFASRAYLGPTSRRTITVFLLDKCHAESNQAIWTPKPRQKQGSRWVMIMNGKFVAGVRKCLIP